MLQDLDKLTMLTTADRDRVHPFSFQVVFTKADMAKLTSTMLADYVREIQKIAPTCMPNPIVTSSTTSTAAGTKFGIDDLRMCIAEAGGFLRL